MEAKNSEGPATIFVRSFNFTLQYEKLEQNIEKIKIQQIKRIKKSMAKLEISLQDLDNI
jgi:hypothetical protein